MGNISHDVPQKWQMGEAFILLRNMKREQWKPLGELDLINRIRRGSTLTSRMVALGIGDDCAILRPPAGTEILVTTDFLLEGRHFLRDRHPPESVGHRCLARGLSDLAAMGAVPLAAFLSLAVPAAMLRTRRGVDWIDGFFLGLNRLGGLHNVALAGGDTSESPSDLIVADIVLVGAAPRGRSLRRSEARSGDVLYVTGSLGGASAELGQVLARRKPARRITGRDNHPHLFPEPRLAVGQALLRRKLATASIDISDGLSTDLTHLCKSSNLRAEIDSAAIPIHPLVRQLLPADPLQAALHGGEDYELLFSAPPAVRIPRSLGGVGIARIGVLRSRNLRHPLITLIESNGERKPLIASGWEHFSRRSK